MDKRVSTNDINHFKSNGWVNIDLQVEDDIIDKALDGVKSMREESIRSKFRYGRVYYDYLFDFNLAAIELPFNNKICSNEVKDFFSKSNIGSIIASFFQTNEFSCELARLFCMGNYNYRGIWHRDEANKSIFDYGKNLENLETLQIGIYFEDQIGFRILKKDCEQGFPNSIVNKKIEKLNSKCSYPIQPDKYTYQRVGGKKGTILIFDPKIYHQGSNQRSRYDFHMRFKKKEIGTKVKNKFQDFYVDSHLHEDILLDDSNIPKSIPMVVRKSTLLRTINSLNYYIPLYNWYKISKRFSSIKKIKKFGHPDYLANTYFQKNI